MLRLRMAALAAASGVLFTLTGCTSTSTSSCDSRMFPRLFQGNWFNHSTPEYMSSDCDCHSSYMPDSMPPVTNLGTVQGPFVMPSAAAPASSIPITNVPPPPPPPNVMTVPPARATPYAPTLN